MQLNAKFFHKHIVTKDICPSSSSSSISFYVCTPWCFVTKEIRDLHRVDELKNFAVNILLKLVVSHVLGSVHQLELCIEIESLSLQNKSNWVLG